MFALNTTEVLNVNSMRRGIDTSRDSNTEERNSDGGEHDGGSALPGPHVHRQTDWLALVDPAAHQKPASHNPDVIVMPSEAQNDPAGQTKQMDKLDNCPNVPTGHKVALFSPVELQNDPGGQVTQPDWPVDGQNVPTGHAVA